MHKLKDYFKIKVMGFSAKHVTTPNQQGTEIAQVPSQSIGLNTQLSAKEIEVLLSLIKKSTFLGEDIESLYNMVIKLQYQYTEQIK